MQLSIILFNCLNPLPLIKSTRVTKRRFMAEVNVGYNVGMEFLNAYAGVCAVSDAKKRDLCNQLAQINAENKDLEILNNILIEAQSKMLDSNGKIKRIDFTKDPKDAETLAIIDKVKTSHPELSIPYDFSERTLTSTLTQLQNKVQNQIHRVNETTAFMNLAFDEGILYTETMQKILEMFIRHIESIISKYNR